jgi:hypothetical protein
MLSDNIPLILCSVNCYLGGALTDKAGWWFLGAQPLKYLPTFPNAVDAQKAMMCNGFADRKEERAQSSF